jgi:hypothetical protein
MEWDTGDKVFNKHTWLASAAQEEPHPFAFRLACSDDGARSGATRSKADRSNEKQRGGRCPRHSRTSGSLRSRTSGVRALEAIDLERRVVFVGSQLAEAPQASYAQRNTWHPP